MTKNKYYDKLKYIEYKFDKPLGTSEVTAVITMIIYAIFLIAPRYMNYRYLTVDLVIVLLFGLYHFIIKEAILKGKIKAYYRRFIDSDGFIIKFYNLIMPVALARVVLLFGYYILFKYDSLLDIRADLVSILNPFTKEFIIAVAISAITFYKAYYSNRYTTPEEYTNGIAYRQNELKMTRNEAHADFCKSKDAEYGITQYSFESGYRYDAIVAEKDYMGVKDIENIEDPTIKIDDVDSRRTARRRN